MALNCCFPKDDELEKVLSGASYSLIRRGGFVESYDYSRNPLKKDIICFDSGSCFENTLRVIYLTYQKKEIIQCTDILNHYFGGGYMRSHLESIPIELKLYHLYI